MSDDLRTVRHPELADILEELHEWVADQDQPVVSALAAGTTIKDLQAAILKLSEQRVAAVRQLYSEGYTHAKIATALGLSRSRVEQLLGR